jgi:hypothetical protein
MILYRATATLCVHIQEEISPYNNEYSVFSLIEMSKHIKFNHAYYFKLQDPVIFTGTIRFQLDPFSQYSDLNIWEVLEQVSILSENIYPLSYSYPAF